MLNLVQFGLIHLLMTIVCQKWDQLIKQPQWQDFWDGMNTPISALPPSVNSCTKASEPEKGTQIAVIRWTNVCILLEVLFARANVDK